MSSFPSRERQLLLEVARQCLTLATEGRELPDSWIDPPDTCEYGGAFVTLRLLGRLRGCIGQIQRTQSLVPMIAHCAGAAAREDPRFDPVRPDELSGIEIEISVLSIPQETSPGEIEIGKHGLLVSQGLKRGLLLPQVASEMRWTAERFLEETCIKAGLERKAWTQRGTTIQRFTAEIFSEADFRKEDSPGPPARAKSRYSIST